MHLNFCQKGHRTRIRTEWFPLSCGWTSHSCRLCFCWSCEGTSQCTTVKGQPVWTRHVQVLLVTLCFAQHNGKPLLRGTSNRNEWVSERACCVLLLQALSHRAQLGFPMMHWGFLLHTFSTVAKVLAQLSDCWRFFVSGYYSVLILRY